MMTIKNQCPDDSEKILSLIKQECQWKFDYESSQDSEEIQLEDLKSHTVNRLDPIRSRELLVHFPAQPEKVQLIECLDSVITLDGKQWPELFLAGALKRAIIHKVKTLNLRQNAFIVAEDIHIRPLVRAATELGFSKIFLVSKENSWLESEKTYLSRRLMGIQFETVLMSDLTLQAQNTNLLLSYFDLNKNKDFVQDLAYFNFMTSGGVVVDLFEGGPHQTLQEEAQKAQLHVVNRNEVLLAWWLELALKFKSELPFTREQEDKLFQKIGELKQNS
jgi:hypothetical protein